MQVGNTRVTMDPICSVGEVRVADDADFAKIKLLCQCHEGWKQEFNKSGTTVWTRANEVSDFNMIKMHSVLKGVSARVLFDVLLDPDYRKKWDPYMAESYEICCLNPNTDIGYYALKAPKPLKNRDLVLIRSWLDRGTEYYVMNRSINHRSEPPRKSCIRAISYITGFVIVPLSQQSCEVTYITQSDPKGKLPVWVVNKMTQLTAPMVMTRLAKAAKDYESWKSKHNPCHKPWLFPEQMRLPRLKATDIRPMQETQQAETIDETDILEDDLQEDIVGEV